jgi:hypothetical protein
MTKADVFAPGGGGEDVADFHIGIGDNDPINEQFHQLTLLCKGGVVQTSSDALTKGFNRAQHPSQFLVLFHLGSDLLGLMLQGRHLFFDRVSPLLILGEREYVCLIRIGQPVALALQLESTLAELLPSSV